PPAGGAAASAARSVPADAVTAARPAVGALEAPSGPGESAGLGEPGRPGESGGTEKPAEPG
ncbi:hypothetical protein ABZX56_32805, partial [Streptomyces parvulus]